MSKQQLLAEKLAANPDGVLERIAAECGVSTLDVVKALPAEQRTLVPGSRFQEIMADLENWGEVLVIVHTPDIVLECTNMPPYTADIQRETGRPVFDITTLVRMAHDALVGGRAPRPI